MKVCPACNQTYTDDAQNFCLNDGATLKPFFGTTFGNSEAPTQMMNPPPATNPNQAFGTAPNQNWGVVTPNAAAAPRPKSRAWLWVLLIFGAVFLLCGGGFAGLVFYSTTAPKYESNFNVSYNSNTSVANTNTKPESSKSALTLEKYNRIKNGMSYRQVVEIIGVEGTEMSSSEIGKYKTASYKWEGEKFQMIFGTFQNDKLLSKTQANLK